MINGGANLSFSQGRERLCRESGFLNGLWKGGDEECVLPWFVKMFEEGVIADLNLLQEEDLPFPDPSSLFLCMVCRALQTGSFFISDQHHDIISDLRGTILKLGGSCEGTCKVSIFIRFCHINQYHVIVNLTHRCCLQGTIVSIGNSWSQ